mgnify:CR=1 FL=1
MKSQLIGQIVVFIIAAVVLILILLFGYRAIRGLIERQEMLALAEFKSDFTSKIEEMRLRYGSVDQFVVALPAKFRELCIVDSNLTLDLSNFEKAKPGLYPIWRAKAANVFLIPGQHFWIDFLSLPDGFCCLDLFGRTLLRLEGIGKLVRVEPWNVSITPCKYKNEITS